MVRRSAPGESLPIDYTVSHTDVGTFANTASVTVSDNDYISTGSANATQSVTVTDVKPTIEVTKSASPASLIEPGGLFTYTFVVTNTSVEPVTITGVSDSVLGPVALPAVVTLAPGASSAPMTATATYTQAGTYANTVTATAKDNENNVATATAPASVTVVAAAPALTLTKQAAPATYNAVDQTITYTYTLTNTGNVTLVGPFTVTDDKAVAAPTLPLPITLAPTASIDFSATHTITQADLDAGSLTNTATGHAVFGGVQVDSNQAQATVNAVPERDALSLTKQARARRPTTHVDQTHHLHLHS